MKQLAETTPQPKPVRFPPWSATLAVFFVFAVYILSSFLAESALLVYGLLQGLAFQDVQSWVTDSTFIQFAGNLLVYSLMAFFIYIFISGYKVSLKSLGVKRPRLMDLGVALLGVVPYVVGYLLLVVVVTALVPTIDVEQEQQLGFEPTQNAFGLALAFISLVVLPPIIEEFVMRGFLFTSLAGRLRFIWAAVITSAIFGLAHLQFGTGEPLLWIAAIDTFVLSLILCYMRYKSGSLWPGVILHALKNGVAFLSIFVFKLV